MYKFSTIGQFWYPFEDINARVPKDAEYEHEGVGKVIYDPSRRGMKKNLDWWCVINVDKNITRYFRYWIKKEYGITLNKPSWDAHISLIRGTKPNNPKLWKQHAGKKIRFRYSHWVRGSKDLRFWNVPVISEDANSIIEELGVEKLPKLHITIGRLYE